MPEMWGSWWVANYRRLTCSILARTQQVGIVQGNNMYHSCDLILAQRNSNKPLVTYVGIKQDSS